MNLRGIDLNLLVVFDALMAERHMTRAGKRIGLSQPAMSAALSRLRQLTQDQLFIRKANGMQPTPHALHIAPAISESLQRIKTTLEPPAGFDPATAKQTFRIGMIDYVSFVLLPELVAVLTKEAPGIKLQVQDITGRSIPDMLQDMSTDLAISKDISRSRQNINKQYVFTEHFVCVTRKENAKINGELDIETFTQLSHILVAPMGYAVGIVDRLLEKQGLQREVTTVFPHFMAAPNIVSNSDVIATLPARLAKRFEQAFSLKIHTPPITIPGFEFAQFWHTRNNSDPAQEWLRNKIHSLANQL